MNSLILNRDFQHPSDGWYQIEALGEHPNADANAVQIIDAEAGHQIVNRFNEDARAGRLRHGQEMLIDHEHFSDQADQETRAYGWLQELQNRADGIYGRIRWTKTGKEAVDGGDYRFFSTEYAQRDLDVLNSAKGAPRRVRPLRLDGLTLTNMPNNRGQKPITNRQAAPAPQLPNGACAPAEVTNKTHTQTKRMKSVCTLLGLAAEADETSAAQAVTALLNRVKSAEEALPPIKNRVTELETQNQSLLTAEVDGLLESRGIKPEDARHAELVPVLTRMTNRDARAKFLDTVVPKPAAGSTAAAEQQKKLTNRAAGNPAGEQGAKADAITPAQLSAEVKKIINRDGLKSFEDGYNTLMRERPELFARA